MSAEDREWVEQREAAKAKQLSLRQHMPSEKELDEQRERTMREQQRMAAEAAGVKPADFFTEGRPILPEELPTAPKPRPVVGGDLSFWIVFRDGVVTNCAPSWQDLKRQLKKQDGVVEVLHYAVPATAENMISFFLGNKETKKPGEIRESFNVLIKEGVVFRSDPD